MNARIEKYLKAYNLVQFCGWSAALICHVFYMDSGISFVLVSIFQLLSVLEIFHAYKKWNNSSPFFCILQIGARLFILCWVYVIALATIFKPIKYFDEVVFVMILSWCIAEMIRYAYYVAELFKKSNIRITWIRYTAFIICYPVGIICEFFILYTIFRYNDILAVKILMIAVVIAYFIAFPMLYLHLLKQRKRKLIHNS